MSKPAKQKVLVTGGGGFLGRYLVKSFLGAGCIVRVIARGATGRDLADHANVELVQLDLRELEQHHHVFADQDLVIHAAAMLHAHSEEERELQTRINVGVTSDVIAACRRARVPRLVHVSTTATIGIPPDGAAPADETFRFNLDHPRRSYHITKREAERLVLAADGPDLETVVVNPGFMFGRHGASYRGADVIERILRRRVVPCTTGGISVVHVEDVVDGVQRVASRGRTGERYILSGPNVSFREIACTVSRLAGERRAVFSVPRFIQNLAWRYPLGRGTNDLSDRLHLDSRFAAQYYSSQKARIELEYKPRAFEQIAEEALKYLNARS